MAAMAALMYTASGDPINNPTSYMKTGKAAYTSSGEEIRNPESYLKKRMTGGPSGKPTSKPGLVRQNGKLKQKAPAGGGVKYKEMFEADGTAIRDIGRLLKSIEAGRYSKPLFKADGEEIRNPIGYQGKGAKAAIGNGRGGAKAAIGNRRGAGPAASGDKQMFEADGTPIRSVEGYLRSVETKGYTKPVFTADGQEIRDPLKYMGARAVAAGGNRNRMGPVGAAEKQMFEADGTPIRNPGAILKKIEAGGYAKALFTADGQEIRNPRRFMGAGATPGGRKGGAMSGGRNGRGARPAASGNKQMFQADGTPIRNPAAYLKKIEANGYTEPLFTAAGEKINNPTAYIGRSGRTSALGKMGRALAGKRGSRPAPRPSRKPRKTVQKKKKEDEL